MIIGIIIGILLILLFDSIFVMIIIKYLRFKLWPAFLMWSPLEVFGGNVLNTLKISNLNNPKICLFSSIFFNPKPYRSGMANPWHECPRWNAK